MGEFDAAEGNLNEAYAKLVQDGDSPSWVRAETISALIELYETRHAAEPDSLDQCDSVGGAYLGNGTTCAAAATSTCPTGACCVVGGSCVDESVIGSHVSQQGCEESLGGSYLGDGTNCASTSCGP